MQYHKLVLDRIPEIIGADGKTCTWETLSDEAYLQLLDEKLNEELAEYQKSKSLEELADLLEVMRAVVRARGWTPEQLEQLRAAKATRRGGFEKRILLTSVRKKEDYGYLLVMRDFLQSSGKLYSTTFPQLVRQRQQGKVFSFQEHLRNVGIDGVKPDIHVCRFLGADRMGESEQEQVAPNEAVAIVRKMSEQLHLPMVEIDSILWSYCASHYGEICTATPHCDACVVRKFCTRKEGYE